MNALTTAPIDSHYLIEDRLEERSAFSKVTRDLQLAVENFVSLERATSNYRLLYRNVVYALHQIMEAIRSCEKAGMERGEIRSDLLPVRLLHRRSLFVARAQDWPRGYAGDFETIEYLCDGMNRVSVEDTLGYCIEEYTINSQITQQHRNKIKLQAEMMLKCCQRKEHARILSIGCGGARDLRLIAGHLRDSKAEFVLCDSDSDALDLAKNELGPLAEKCTFVQGRVPRVMSRLKALGKFDLVVAGGLFDYLPNRWVELMVGEIWRHFLHLEGILFFTNIALNNPYRVWMEYLADWSLIERSKYDLERLCRNAGVDGRAVSITREATNLTLIATVAKSN